MTGGNCGFRGGNHHRYRPSRYGLFPIGSDFVERAGCLRNVQSVDSVEHSFEHICRARVLDRRGKSIVGMLLKMAVSDQLSGEAGGESEGQRLRIIVPITSAIRLTSAHHSDSW